jgi:hypothetical protein
LEGNNARHVQALFGRSVKANWFATRKILDALNRRARDSRALLFLPWAVLISNAKS